MNIAVDVKSATVLLSERRKAKLQITEYLMPTPDHLEPRINQKSESSSVFSPDTEEEIMECYNKCPDTDMEANESPSLSDRVIAEEPNLLAGQNVISELYGLRKLVESVEKTSPN